MSSTPMRRFHVDPEVGPLVVAALGGKAFLVPGEPRNAETSRRDVKRAGVALADLARHHGIVITHGSGPHASLLALESEAVRDLRTYPLDLLDVEGDGTTGYMLERELSNELPDRLVVSLLTQVVVDALDPAFRTPSTPIGPAFSEQDARRLATERGWSVAANSHGWRRVIASPAPRSIVELPTIELLLDAGVVVITASGGGIPVVVDVNGGRHGVEAVVDKDFSAALLAHQLGATTLLLCTDVPAVMRTWDGENGDPIARTTPSELRALELERTSIAPKVDAACWFASTTGGTAVIGSPADAEAMVRGEAGTIVVADS